MSGLIVRVITSLATFASLVGAGFLGYDPTKPVEPLRAALLVAAVVLGSLHLTLEVSQFLRQRAKLVPSGPKIRRYMTKLIRGGGRVAIFSRDLSWVNDIEVKNLLLNKSRADEVRLVVPHDSALVSELEQTGARVVRYPSLGYNLTTRFTIINEGTSGQSVAVGKPEGEFVRVEHFSSDHSVVSMAKDMMELLTRYELELERLRAPGAGA